MRLDTWSFLTGLVLVSFVLVALELPADTRLTMAAFSLSSGVVALVLMAAAALLGARWRVVESAFGGLDRVYETHKWLGVWALAFASVHLVFKAGMQGWDTAAILALPPFHTRLVRQLSFVALMLIVLLALNRRIPYRTWRWWHKLSGPLFLIVVLHWLSFKTPIALASPAGLWLATVSTLGVAGALYKLLLYPALSRHAEYRIVDIVPGPAAVALSLEPIGKSIAFEPGQFAFVSIQSPGLREPHPFTIASTNAPGEPIQFLVRALGDYTGTLVADTRIGMHADVYAPFGRFKRPSASKREIWVAGGIGISPFIAWLRDGAATGLERVTLFNFHTPGRDFPSTEALDTLTRERGVECVQVPEGSMSPAFRERFAAIARTTAPADIDICFCGPQGLLADLRAAMAEHGVPASKLRFERFDFR